MTEGDTRFLEGVVQRTVALFAAAGGHEPIAYVERYDGKMAMLESNGLGTEDDKETFVNVIRYHSIRSGSKRAGVAAEGWAILGHDDETMMEVGRYSQQGGGIREHPLAREYVTITVESDAGVTLQIMAIDRRIPEMAILTPEGGPRHIPWTAGYESYGIFNSFHVRSELRITAATMQWAAEMDRHMAEMVHDAPNVDQAPPPSTH